MTQQTDALREIWDDVADDETVVEHQQNDRDRGAIGDVDTDLTALIAAHRDDHPFQTSLTTDDLVTVVKAYFDGASDTEIAARLGDRSRDQTVKRARLNLHLFRNADFDAPFDTETLARLRANDRSYAECGDELGVSTSTVRGYARAFDARDTADTTEYAFEKQAEAILEAATIEEEMSTMVADGLDDAIKGAGGN